MTINKNTLAKARVLVLKGGRPVDYSVLDNDEFVDTGYGFINEKGIEVCSDNELYELE